MMMGIGFLVLLLVGVGLFVVLLGGLGLISRQGVVTESPGGHRKPAARKVLDERLARGEISLEQYETIREQLER